MNINFNKTEFGQLDLNLLLVFSALMREQSVTRASLILHLSAPAVSMSLGRLRIAFQDRLFVRTGGRMEPTAFANALWQRIEPALASLESAFREVGDFDPATCTRTLRFAMPDDLEFVILPKLLQRLAETAPHVRLSVRPTDFRAWSGRIDEGDADLALIPEPAAAIESRHRILPLYSDNLSVLYDARVTKFIPEDISAYLTLPHVIVSTTGALRDNLDAHLESLGYSRNVVAAISHYPTLPFILKLRASIASVPSVAAFYLAEAYGLDFVSAPIITPNLHLALAWHVRADADPANAWLRLVISEIIQTLKSAAQLKQSSNALHAI
ncbi:LysR substrate-binding domain-containing protein [Methylocella sp. CPCC 101449]|uniref:LysR family transcriptional regulator n=1 Tax=Methylocella sp. CPCC 101449 TaxID=2987531 RepID=UPI00288EE605|nr:LysR substrate-binding domain-containing protein [Methylocella sp. CPCC 101449]MDT2024576.1 LysR substrate-binding domain-containing protein [Methylocella sp. CPCC 101449]